MRTELKKVYVIVKIEVKRNEVGTCDLTMTPAGRPPFPTEKQAKKWGQKNLPAPHRRFLSVQDILILSNERREESGFTVQEVSS